MYGKPGVCGPARKYLMNDYDDYHSPLVAVGAAKNLLGGGLSARLKSPAAHQAEREANYRGMAEAALKGDTQWFDRLQELAAGDAPTQAAKDFAQQLVNTIKSKMPKKKTVLEEGEELVGDIGSSKVGVEIVKGLMRRGRRRGGGYYIDSYGRRRRRQPQYEEEDVGGDFQPADAASLGGRGGGKLASQLGKGALVVGAGVAAYFATKYLTEAFARGVRNKEEAGAAIAMANGKALRAIQAKTGKPPTPAQRAELKQAMSQQLVALGYDPVTLTRKRGAIESFFSGLEEE